MHIISAICLKNTGMYTKRISGKSIGERSYEKEKYNSEKRLNVLLGVCLIPLAVLVIYLLIMMNRFSNRYDLIVENITKANAYNIDFKENMDYVMYIIVVNSERAAELVDTEQPHVMINEAREVFENLYEEADRDYAKKPESYSEESEHSGGPSGGD